MHEYEFISEDKYVVLSTTEGILNGNVTTSQRWKGSDIREWQTDHFIASMSNYCFYNGSD